MGSVKKSEGGQSAIWTVLSEEENRAAWDQVDDRFHFRPTTLTDGPNFNFSIPVDIYHIGQSPLRWNDEEATSILHALFADCIGREETMYALDWRHTGYRYDPRLGIPDRGPVFIPDTRYGGDGYNAYFPSFYPNGDYYFFLAMDFTWGYLTHPWQEKAWVFGHAFMEKVRQKKEKLGFVSAPD